MELGEALLCVFGALFLFGWLALALAGTFLLWDRVHRGAAERAALSAQGGPMVRARGRVAVGLPATGAIYRRQAEVVAVPGALYVFLMASIPALGGRGIMRTHLSFQAPGSQHQAPAGLGRTLPLTAVRRDGDTLTLTGRYLAPLNVPLQVTLEDFAAADVTTIGDLLSPRRREINPEPEA